MFIRTPIAAALAFVVIAGPAVAQEPFNGPRFKRNQEGGPPVVQQFEEGEYPPPAPPKRLRKNRTEAGPDIVIETPSSDQILRKLEAPAANAPVRTKRVTIREFKRRRTAPRGSLHRYPVN